jgi:hypothetical protein
MRVLAIDPGNELSAAVIWDGAHVAEFWKLPNDTAFARIREASVYTDYCAIERIACYGMAVGAEVFETCVWTGRFMEAYGSDRVERIERMKVKMHLCHSPRAKDGNVRQAILDRFGGKDRAVGKKAAPGPLYGVSGDVWAALGVALTSLDRRASASPQYRVESGMTWGGL